MSLAADSVSALVGEAWWLSGDLQDPMLFFLRWSRQMDNKCAGSSKDCRGCLGWAHYPLVHRRHIDSKGDKGGSRLDKSTNVERNNWIIIIWCRLYIIPTIFIIRTVFFAGAFVVNAGTISPLLVSLFKMPVTRSSKLISSECWAKAGARRTLKIIWTLTFHPRIALLLFAIL